MAMSPFLIYRKLLIGILALLLLILSVSGIFSQDKHITSKPTGINSWKPAHLLTSPYQTGLLDSVIRTDFTITMRDGVIIDCLKWIPTRLHPVGGFPTVIMHHGYGDNKETLSEFCRLQAQYGYYTMTFSVRGQGNSGGLSNLISRTEALDLIEIVNRTRTDTASGAGPSKILIMGGSQGGAVPLMAACMGGLNVAAIINSVAPPNFASSWIENGCTKMTLLWTVDYTPDTARYNSQVDRMSNWILADTKPYWDSLAYWMPIDRDFTSILPNCTIPVMVEAAWQDKFFNADGWMLNIDKITAPLTSYMGAVQGHGADHSPTEDIWHMDWFNKWFFQWLWGMNTTILDEAKYQYASTHFPVVNNYYSFTHDSSTILLRNNSALLRLYLNKGQRLKTTVQTGNNSDVVSNKITNGYTLTQAVNEEFTGTNFNSKFKIDSSKFLSDVLTTDIQWTGAPVIKVDYKSSAQTFCQFNYQIYEVLPTGERRFINRANFTDRNYTKNSRRQTTFRGQAHSHIFHANSKILVIISNFDRAHTDATFFDTNPFVLPTMKNGDHTVYFNANSYIEFPIINHSAATNINFFAEEENEIINNEPYKYNLLQNFPNPFNPSTMIDYTIAKNEQVQIKVFDLIGREIVTLVNEMQVPGSYNVTFNAKNLSSGIYFYRISAGSFTDVKRMVLVK